MWNIKKNVDKKDVQNNELQMLLLKMVAEKKQEKFLYYDRKTDTVVLNEIRNGEFYPLEIVEGFVGKQDMEMNRIHEKDKGTYRYHIQNCLANPSIFEFDLRYIVPEIGPRWYRVYLMSIADKSGYVTNFVAHMVNIQEQKEYDKNMKKQAERDSLSGVYNHAAYEKLCTELAEQKSDGLMYVMVDIDNFKQINDTYGHQAGDQVIAHVGSVLETAVKGRGYAGRIGGDEFSFCVYDMYDREIAQSFCINVKSALNQYVNTVPFTVSMGVTTSTGRKLTFQELYFEADEAVYFAKESGKNQIVYKDEIPRLKQKKFEATQSEYALTEEEIALDQKMEYVAIVDPVEKKILYMNEEGRKILGVSLEEVQNMYCYKLFKGCDKECSICEYHANHVQVLQGEQAAGLEKYLPHGKFILQSRYTMWKGKSARSVAFMDVNDAKHVEMCMEAEMRSHETFSKCWALIMESNSGDTEYEKVLRVLSDYYDAECCAIVTKDMGTYQELFEYHRNSGQQVAEGLRASLEQDLFEKCEVLLDKEDLMRPRHIDEILLSHKDIAIELQKKFVHNTIGIALRKFGQIIGILMIINPRDNMNDYTMLRQLSVFFGTDLVRKKLTDNKIYEEDHDMLTRLWSREFYSKGWQLDYLPMFREAMGVFTADIYRLKDINRKLGYKWGNDRIVALAEVFRRVFAGYSIFRYDDDQVLVVCHNIEKGHFQKMVDYAIELFEELDFEVSHGSSWKAEPELLEIIKEAEDYMQINRAFLEKENAAAEKMAKKIEKDVVEEIKQGNFRMFLQPKTSLTTGKTVGAEALVRLYHREKGYISPAMFIPLLEEQNEVHIIDLFILRRTFQFQKAAKDAGREVVPISVNFSKHTVMYPGLLDYIKELCELFGLQKGMIRIEITETISNMDHLEVRNIADALHDMGFAISMDDFGTKYSNMAVLTQFEFDTVKIDRSMIIDIEENPKNQTVLKHTIGMLKDLGMETIVEGVETAEQVAVLKELGCETVQGFFFGKPEPEEKFYELFM